ncbi:S-layer homology domain-containing protein [Paenibacillus hamazuiensis]|uniref:S-layer homology domain-containing protein n=1 Tax=Paenibacillus hamazuiensis TaxID=2936508 RepID=UPI00200D5350|nr:S-layer homology domain-containing protein [Paenibacillus hamazuiensis]
MKPNIATWYLKIAACFALLPILLLITRTVFAKPELSDISGHWAEPLIMQAVRQGYASGYPDGTFAPDRAASKAEFAAMLVQALYIPVVRTDEDGEDGAWFRPYIRSLADLGLYLPGEVDEQSWTDSMSRVEMARLAVRAARLGGAAANGPGAAAETYVAAEGAETPTAAGALNEHGAAAPLSLSKTADTAEDNAADEWIRASVRLGILEETSANGGMAPGQAVTRAQAVAVIERLLRLDGRSASAFQGGS